MPRVQKTREEEVKKGYQAQAWVLAASFAVGACFKTCSDLRIASGTEDWAAAAKAQAADLRMIRELMDAAESRRRASLPPCPMPQPILENTGLLSKNGRAGMRRL